MCEGQKIVDVQNVLLRHVRSTSKETFTSTHRHHGIAASSSILAGLDGAAISLQAQRLNTLYSCYTLTAQSCLK